MFKKLSIFVAGALMSSTVFAAETPINGTVQSRCIITTDTAGTYANPNAYTLTTSPTDGGEHERIPAFAQRNSHGFGIRPHALGVG